MERMHNQGKFGKVLGRAWFCEATSTTPGEALDIAVADDSPRPFWRRANDNRQDYLFQPRGDGARGGELVVAFAGLGRDSEPSFEFRRALAPHGLTSHLLFLRDSDLQWYVGRRAWFAAVVQAACAAVEPSQLQFVGASAGGWGALFFQAHYFPRARVCAFSPQAFLDWATRSEEGDERWAPYVNYLNKSLLTRGRAHDTDSSGDQRGACGDTGCTGASSLLCLRGAVPPLSVPASASGERDKRAPVNRQAAAKPSVDFRCHPLEEMATTATTNTFGAAYVHYNIHHSLDSRHAMHLRRLTHQPIHCPTQPRGGSGDDGGDDGLGEGAGAKVKKKEVEVEVEEEEEEVVGEERGDRGTSLKFRIRCVPHDGPRDGLLAHGLAKQLRDNGQLPSLLDAFLASVEDNVETATATASAATSQNERGGGGRGASSGRGGGGSGSGGRRGTDTIPIVDYVRVPCPSNSAADDGHDSKDHDDDDDSIFVPRFDLDQLYAALNAGKASLHGSNKEDTPPSSLRQSDDEKKEGGERPPPSLPQPPTPRPLFPPPPQPLPAAYLAPELPQEVLEAARHAMLSAGFFFLRPSRTSVSASASSFSSSSSNNNDDGGNDDDGNGLMGDAANTATETATSTAEAEAQTRGETRAASSPSSPAAVADSSPSRSRPCPPPPPSPLPSPTPSPEYPATADVVARCYRACEDMANEIDASDPSLCSKRGGKSSGASSFSDSGGGGGSGSSSSSSSSSSSGGGGSGGGVWSSEHAKELGLLGGWRRGDNELLKCDSFRCAVEDPPPLLYGGNHDQRRQPRAQQQQQQQQQQQELQQWQKKHRPVTPSCPAAAAESVVPPAGSKRHLWPSERDLPGFTTAVHGYAQALSTHCAAALLGLFEEALCVPRQFLSNRCLAGNKLSYLTTRTYPTAASSSSPLSASSAASSSPSSSSAAAAAAAAAHMRTHTDSEFFTILHFNAPGLEVLTRELGPHDNRGSEVREREGSDSGGDDDDEAAEVAEAAARTQPRWVPLPSCDSELVQGCFVVIFDDAFEVFTNGKVPATVHRVRCPPNAAAPRTSLVMFVALDELVEPPAAFGKDRRRSRKQLEQWWARVEAVSGALI